MRGRSGARAKRSRLFARPLIIALALVVAGCTGQADPDATGGELYSQFCARCHAADLSGGIGPALGAGSGVVDMPDSYINDVIANGRGSMPAFGNTLSDDQVARVVDFIRTEQES